MKLSIITINYNNLAGLKCTLDSVASQTYREFEHIIIDGGSTDGSVDVIREYGKSQTSNVQWISEKDKGIYDAMNKGVAKSSGEYLYFLNSGDTLVAPSVIGDLLGVLDDSDFLIGRVNKTYRNKVLDQTDLLSEKDMSLYYMYLHGINHQSALIKRNLLVRTPYDISVRMGADWKFFVQTIVLGGASTKFVDIMFANYDLSGLSSNTPAVRRERETILDTIVPERIARDYRAVAPHYFEVIRVEWLLRHPFWYKLYRGLTTFARKITKS